MTAEESIFCGITRSDFCLADGRIMIAGKSIATVDGEIMMNGPLLYP